MTIEEVYSRLSAMKNTVDKKKDENFESKKAFKYLYNAVLDILDDLDYIKENDDLFDDDDDWGVKEEKEEYDYEIADTEDDPIPKPLFDMDDIV
jgi:hypothetical protein